MVLGYKNTSACFKSIAEQLKSISWQQLFKINDHIEIMHECCPRHDARDMSQRAALALKQIDKDRRKSVLDHALACVKDDMKELSGPLIKGVEAMCERFQTLGIDNLSKSTTETIGRLKKDQRAPVVEAALAQVDHDPTKLTSTHIKDAQREYMKQCDEPKEFAMEHLPGADNPSEGSDLKNQEDETSLPQEVKAIACEITEKEREVVEKRSNFLATRFIKVSREVNKDVSKKISRFIALTAAEKLRQHLMEVQ
jgi:hypothetical protein